MTTNNFVFALIVLGIYLVITQVESVYLIPRLVGRRVQLHPAVTFAGIISGAVVFGVLGVLLSTPTIASARVILLYITRKLRDIEPFKPAYVQTEIRIPGLIAGHRINGVIFDLDGTLTEIDWRFANEMAGRLHLTDRIWPLQDRRLFFQRVMALLEGPINRWIGLLSWLQLHEDVRRMMPFLNWLRGLPPADSLTLRPGTVVLLKEISHHYALGLMTLRPCAEVDAFLQQSPLPFPLFAAVTTGEKSNGAGAQNDAVSTLCKELGLNPSSVLVVSDSPMKLRPAQAIGAVQCGVLGGLGRAGDFGDVDLLVADLGELRSWL